jgi:hypothetical protein
MYDVRCTMYASLIVYKVYTVNKVRYKPYILYIPKIRAYIVHLTSYISLLYRSLFSPCYLPFLLPVCMFLLLLPALPHILFDC